MKSSESLRCTYMHRGGRPEAAEAYLEPSLSSRTWWKRRRAATLGSGQQQERWSQQRLLRSAKCSNLTSWIRTRGSDNSCWGRSRCVGVRRSCCNQLIAQTGFLVYLQADAQAATRAGAGATVVAMSLAAAVAWCFRGRLGAFAARCVFAGFRGVD